jgi:orotidine 5'-phosphate decarboxylase subfamily 2
MNNPSSNISFFEQLQRRCREVNSHLCVGLDPHPSELSIGCAGKCGDEISEEERCNIAFDYCRRIIDGSGPHVAAFKPNAAFFESLGPNHGMATLRRVILYIRKLQIPVLLDVKRGDIGTTASAYAEACYDHLGADAVTLSPLMGWDSVQPFVTGKYSSRGAFLLCKTSNPGSNDLLALSIHQPSNKQKLLLYEHIAQLSSLWSTQALPVTEKFPSAAAAPPFGLVVGATDPTALAKVRSMVGPNVWILAPGVGAQGGDLEKAIAAGFNNQGTCMLIPISRGISQAADPGTAAVQYKNSINEAIKKQIVMHNDLAIPSSNAIIAPFEKDFIEFCLAQGVLKFGSFVLKSGRTSPYFFNAGLFCSGKSLHMLGMAYSASIMSSKVLCNNGSVNFDVIFGPAYKGIPLAAVVSSALYAKYDVNVDYAYNRKEAKDHGEKGFLVGASMKNKRVLIIDDVITAGTAIRESVNMLKSVDAIPIGVSIALDRMEKVSLEDPISAVQAVMRDIDIPVVPIITLPQLQSYISSCSYGADVIESITAYRAKYGV